MEYEGYCVKCREKRTIKDGKVETTAKGRPVPGVWDDSDTVPFRQGRKIASTFRTAGSRARELRSLPGGSRGTLEDIAEDVHREPLRSTATRAIVRP
jgi:hypothetical protein